MEKSLLFADVEEIQQNIEITSKRLRYIIKNFNQENLTEEEKILVKDFILELLNNIETENKNLIIYTKFIKNYV